MNQKKIFCVDGNIGSGKTTLLRNLKANFPNEIDVITEPVDIWNTFGDEGQGGLLSMFYREPSNYAFKFQIMIFFTFVKEIVSKIKASTKPIIILERSPLSSLHVFIKMLREEQIIDKLEGSLIDLMYEFYQDIGIDIVCNIFLEVTPVVCLDRIETRRRHGEDAISLGYLNKLNQKFKEYYTPDRHDVRYFDFNPSRLDVNYYWLVEANIMNLIRDLTNTRHMDI